MKLKLLVIDDHEAFRQLVWHHVSAEWPDATLVEHDPDAFGRLPNHFTGAGYDAVILGYNLGSCYTLKEENGLHWLQDFRRRPGFPPVIFVTGGGDERLAVSVMKAGAHDYLPKACLTHDLLIESIRSAVRPETAGADNAVEVLDPIAVRGHRVIRRIAARGPSSVYLAYSTEAGSEVVLKVLRQMGDAADGKGALERFLHEYEVIARLKHPNVVRIFSHGIADDHAYLTMEYFPHGDLKARIRLGISPEQALDYLAQMARALQVIHGVHILHRDLKPANVMVRDDQTLALIDFGLAKQMRLHSDMTETGEVFGTPYYMSPEQGHAASVDERGDLYSLGVVFFEMLTGTKPYLASSPLAVIYKHSHAPIPTLPGNLAHMQPLIDRLMAKEPDERFQSAGELLEAIGAAGPSSVRAAAEG